MNECSLVTLGMILGIKGIEAFIGIILLIGLVIRFTAEVKSLIKGKEAK